MKWWHIETNTVPPKTHSLGKVNVINSVITKQEGMNTKELKTQFRKLQSGTHNKREIKQDEVDKYKDENY